MSNFPLSDQLDDRLGGGHVEGHEIQLLFRSWVRYEPEPTEVFAEVSGYDLHARIKQVRTSRPRCTPPHR